MSTLCFPHGDNPSVALDTTAGADAGAEAVTQDLRLGGSRLPIVQRLLAAHGAPDSLSGDVTMLLRNPDGFDAVATIEELVAYVAEQTTFVETRMGDALDLGNSVLRLALEDIVSENRALLNRIAGGSA